MDGTESLRNILETLLSRWDGCEGALPRIDERTVLRLRDTLNAETDTAERPDLAVGRIGRAYEEGLESRTRRKTGTHYTPGDLAAVILEATLEPFVYDLRNKNSRIKSSAEILALKICDPAMGCGVFLVQTCRLLAERLLEAWETEGRTFGEPCDRVSLARRLVAEHCLYGIDVDPVAVELARLSIRLFAGTLGENVRVPDAHFRCADSLLGGDGAFDWECAFPDVFRRGRPGFDAVVGNPPFLGGRKMRGVLGNAALRRLKAEWPHASLNADLCAFFLLRAAKIVRKYGTLGFVATKTIAQGDTARTGLLYLCEKNGWSVRRAVSSFPWPGTAAVRAAWIVLREGVWNGMRKLDGRNVVHISPVLDEGETWGEVRPISRNIAMNFQGSVLAGEGFVLSREEADRYIEERATNAQVIFPYLGGSEVNADPEHAATRRVIDFRDNPLERCEREWPELLERVRRLVKPSRDRAARASHRKYWWQHGEKRPALYARIREKEFTFVLTRHTKYLALARVPTRQVFQESLCVLDLPGWWAFAAIQSSIHEAWARRGSSTLGEGLRYTPSDYFDTFPFLHLRPEIMESPGRTYYEHRAAAMRSLETGLTGIYNRLHDPGERDRRIVELRELRRGMDTVVCAAYGWDDIDLRHDFYESGVSAAKGRGRFTITESARREILRRLAELASETKAGMEPSATQ